MLKFGAGLDSSHVWNEGSRIHPVCKAGPSVWCSLGLIASCETVRVDCSLRKRLGSLLGVWSKVNKENKESDTGSNVFSPLLIPEAFDPNSVTEKQETEKHQLNINGGKAIPC